ncbi:hypothetical protein N0V83_006838 [Neocucurbitaria cava]|uniref:NmrA-like domain-containing protein n=1 Tax=Neocucurbitaria cava TaxID=798079 RepID=A0A9W9CK94_9PLEO|nr:hypothetical protein N0V83_006838 [Neocucurbitaria cava]
MVKIAVAGGSGSVAQEIIDILVATKKHDISIFTRSDISAEVDPQSGVTYVKTDYASVQVLSSILQGTHTVLSFISPHKDQSGAFAAQKNLIDASVDAGVKRFAPSEWAAAKLEHLHWYEFKADTRQYLQDINSHKKAIEYCLFQPGLFINYLTRPYKSMEHIKALETPFDLHGRRLLVLDDADDARITFTTVNDLANVVAKAIEFEGTWPVIGGVRGTDLSIGELITLSEELRGPVKVEKLKASDLEAGTWSSSWVPKLEHPSISPEQVEVISKGLTAGLVLAFGDEVFHSSEEWNKLLPDYEFEDAKTFLAKTWQGKP